MRGMTGDHQMLQRIDRMMSDSQSLLVALSKDPPDPKAIDSELQMFADLNAMALDLSSGSRRYVNSQLTTLREAARSTRQSLAWQGTALIVGTVVLGFFFAGLIVRPIRQTGRAIRQLGEGGFDRPITVTGPPEIAMLGQELDWLRRRLNSLEQAKGKFLRHMSHELKTPLASIREGTELLIDGTAGELSPTQYEVASILKNNSLELQNMIENLLNFSAQQTMEDTLNRTEFRLSRIINEIRENHHLSLVGKQLRWDVQGKDSTLVADRDRIRAALDNLVSNAIRFSPDGGTVGIKVYNNGMNFIIEVSDQGPGVGERDRELIFEPFYQGKDPGHGHLRGTGLGLSVARECVEAHGGNIELIEDYHDGSCFRVTLPKHENQ
jgi:two-component system sensor histidine kinase GlrK